MLLFAKRWERVGLVVASVLLLVISVALVQAQTPSRGRGMMGGMRGGAGNGMGQHQGMMGRMGQQGMHGMGGQGGMQPGQGMGPMPGMMGEAEMQNFPEPMRMRMHMMMDMQINEHDPAGLLALKDELGLTREQILELNKILADCRKQSAALMTAPQREKLRELGKTPDTARAMQQQMMQGMHGAPGGRGR